MYGFICTACGAAFAPTGDDRPPSRCAVCEDERQFVPATGQGWTTHEELARGHANSFRQHRRQLLSIVTAPQFAIGQRAFLILSPHGNVLWDCVTLLDEATIATIKALGGISAIAVSHPHFYTSMSRWSGAFDAPVFLNEADRRWVCDHGGHLVFWEGDSKEIQPGMTLVRCGGHFAGSAVLHWESGGVAGALFSGDTLQVVQDRKHVSFMRSYPNLVPLSAKAVERIVARLAPYRFDAVYGAFPDREIEEDGAGAVTRSAERYLRAISGQGPADAEGQAITDGRAAG